MEIRIHSVLDTDPETGAHITRSTGNLDLPASDEEIANAIKLAGVKLNPHQPTSFDYSFKLDWLNGKIVGPHKISELNSLARYLKSLSAEDCQKLRRFAARCVHLTPSECMIDTPRFYGNREFVVAIIPEQFHSVPPVGHLRLPAPDEEFIDAIDRARSDGAEFYIEVRDLKRSYLEDSVLDCTNLYALNHLAQRLQEMDGTDELLFEALVKMEKSTPNVARLINLSHNLEHCVLAPASDFDELGHFALENNFFPEYDTIPEELFDMLDYEKIGRRVHDEQGGIFLNGCYIVNLASEGEMLELYTGNPKMPNLLPESVMRLHLAQSETDGNPVYLQLPATERDIETTAKSLGWESIGGRFFISCHSGIAKLDAALTGRENIYVLSDFAECMSLVNRLAEYKFNPEIVTAADYGEMELLRLHKLDRSCAGMEHFDFVAFGKVCLAQNGAQITPYGAIIKVPNAQTISQDAPPMA